MLNATIVDGFFFFRASTEDPLFLFKNLYTFIIYLIYFPHKIHCRSLALQAPTNKKRIQIKTAFFDKNLPSQHFMNQLTKPQFIEWTQPGERTYLIGHAIVEHYTVLTHAPCTKHVEGKQFFRIAALSKHQSEHPEQFGVSEPTTQMRKGSFGRALIM